MLSLLNLVFASTKLPKSSMASSAATVVSAIAAAAAVIVCLFFLPHQNRTWHLTCSCTHRSSVSPSG